MADCLLRTGRHPMGTPLSHHGERRCSRCRVVGCVVPRCPRYRFRPRQATQSWDELAMGRGSESLWRCAECRSVETRPA